VNAGRPRPNTIQDCPSYARLPGLLDLSDGAYAYNAAGFIVASERLGLGGNWQGWGTPGPATFLRANKVLCPSDMVAVGDTCVLDIANYFADGFLCLSAYDGTDSSLGLTATLEYPDFNGAANAKWLARRHAGRWNFAFCDGHTENRRIREMFDPRQLDQIRRWNYDHQPHPELISQQYPGLH
jgi:prepilin-type processing-associated H-X9-DG protein